MVHQGKLTPYRLSIARELERFRPEIEFACAFLEQCHPLVRNTHADRVLHYGPSEPKGSIKVPALVFPRAVSVDEEGIHPNLAGITEIEEANNSVRLLPKDLSRPAWARRDFDYDPLGLIFFMLSRLEERGHPACAKERDKRFPLSASLLHRLARPDFPAADISARDLAAAILQTDDPPLLTSYKVWLTHDVDRFRGYQYPFDPIKSAGADILLRQNLRSAAKTLRKGFLSGEPWRSARYIMDLSEDHGLTSRFYLMGRSNHPKDSPYAIRYPKTMRRLGDEISARGHALGFHPGYGTRRDATEWLRQKTSAEEILGRELKEGRQHRLLFDADSTWDIWDSCGMEFDATLGYPQHSGFRSGTCRIHPTYSLRHRRRLSLMEKPTAIMDFSFFGGRYRSLDVEKALDESHAVIDICRKYGGDLVILFHTHQVTEPHTLFYEELLKLV